MKTLKYKHIVIKEIDSSMAYKLSSLLQNADKEYSKYFIPFDFDYETIKSILSKKKRDCFFGIFINDEIVGFYMLRGFDQGYEVPSYGVWISSKYAGYGLSRLTLQYAETFCKINRIKKIMLKVHPKNIRAKKIYEMAGYYKVGIDHNNDNIIYNKKLL